MLSKLNFNVCFKQNIGISGLHFYDHSVEPLTTQRICCITGSWCKQHWNAVRCHWHSNAQLCCPYVRAVRNCHLHCCCILLSSKEPQAWVRIDWLIFWCPTIGVFHVVTLISLLIRLSVKYLNTELCALMTRPVRCTIHPG